MYITQSSHTTSEASKKHISRMFHFYATLMVLLLIMGMLNINKLMHMVMNTLTCEYSISRVSQHTLMSVVKRVPPECGLDGLTTSAHI